jgi:hypothetical protein
LNVPQERLRALEAELRRELIIGHVLYGRQVQAKAIRDDSDDVVFELDDGSLAVVHLTWATGSDATWPYTLLFENLEALSKSDEWDIHT